MIGGYRVIWHHLGAPGVTSAATWVTRETDPAALAAKLSSYVHNELGRNVTVSIVMPSTEGYGTVDVDAGQLGHGVLIGLS